MQEFAQSHNIWYIVDSILYTNMYGLLTFTSQMLV